jgi:hypothetical protein
MRRFALTAPISTGVLFASVDPLVAQQAAKETPQTPTVPTATPVTPAPADATSPAKVTPSATTTAAAPNSDPQSKKVIRVSKDYIKRLANVGYYPKNDKGQLVFCKKDTPLGSRFSREACMDGDQLAMFLEGGQAQRDAFLNRPCLGPPQCGQ